MDAQQRYDRLAAAVKKMLAAQADARKNKMNQQKWVIANTYEKEVKDIMDPKPMNNNQASFEWLAQ